QMKKIAFLAEAHHVPLAPHCTTTPLGASASLHVAASIPFLLIHETAPGALQWGETFLRKDWTVGPDGHVVLTEQPGLRVTMDLDALAKAAANPITKFVWPKMRLRDGSIADY